MLQTFVTLKNHKMQYCVLPYKSNNNTEKLFLNIYSPLYNAIYSLDYGVKSVKKNV